MLFRLVKTLFLALVMLVGMCTHAQNGTLPMSQIVHDRYLPALHAYGSNVHTAIKPFRYGDVKHLDSSKALLSFLDAPIPDSILPGQSHFRYGPLVDALAGVDLSSDDVLTYQAGAGFWLDADLGPKWSLHLNAQAWSTALPSYLDSAAFAARNIGGLGYVDGGSTYTHYDLGGYVNYSPNHFFDLSLGRGKNFFGEGMRSLFLSDNAYSYPYLRISTNVWKVRYINLFMQLNDIRGSEGLQSNFLRKYASMHYLSWNISKRVNFGIFESIIWQSNDDQYERGFDISYLNPVIFYRPVEFGLGSPDNALLGFAMNVKVGMKGLVYWQLMFDEFLLSEIRNGTGWFGNKQALQLGMVFHDAFGTSGLGLRSEVNVVRPFMYTHSDTRQNYAHHGQALAHPHGSNFYEWINRADLRKGRFTWTNILRLTEMGVDTGAFSYGNNIFRPENDRPQLPNVSQYQNRGYYLFSPSKATIIQNELRATYDVAPASGMQLMASYTLRSMKGNMVSNQLDHWFRLGVSTAFRQRDHTLVPRYVLE